MLGLLIFIFVVKKTYKNLKKNLNKNNFFIFIILLQSFIFSNLSGFLFTNIIFNTSLAAVLCLIKENDSFIRSKSWLLVIFIIIKDNNGANKLARAAPDIPKIFNVEIFKNGLNVEKVVNKAKTTGEPPLMLAMSVFFAIKDAIASISNYNRIPDLSAPATAEKILLSIKKLKNIV